MLLKCSTQITFISFPLKRLENNELNLFISRKYVEMLQRELTNYMDLSN